MFQSGIDKNSWLSYEKNSNNSQKKIKNFESLQHNHSSGGVVTVASDWTCQPANQVHGGEACLFLWH